MRGRRPASASSRWASSARLSSVTSSITLIAMATSPSLPRTGVDLTRLQRSPRSRGSEKRITASALWPSWRAIRPGSRSVGNGWPSSSSGSKRRLTSATGAASRSSSEANPSISTAVSFANSRLPSGAWAVTASATPLRMAASWPRDWSASARATRSSSSSRSRSSSYACRPVMSRMKPVNMGGSASPMRRDRELDRELRPVAPQGPELEPVAEKGALAGLHAPGQRLAMRVAQVGGHDQLGHLDPYRVLARVAEHLDGGGVQLDHPPEMVDRHDRVQGRLEHGALACLGHRERGGGASRLEKLPDLPTHGAEQVEHRVIGRTGLAREQLHHADDSSRGSQRERAARLEAGRLGRLGPGKRGIERKVLEPLGGSGLVHASGDADALRHDEVAGHRLEVLRVDARCGPRLHAAQRAIGENLPQPSDHESQRLADRVQQARRRVEQAGGVLQGGGDRVLDPGPELVAPRVGAEPRDVDRDGTGEELAEHQSRRGRARRTRRRALRARWPARR